MTNKIYVKPVGGLCNRIRVIDSFLTLAKEVEKSLVVVWEKNSELNCSWDDLFQHHAEFELIETKAVYGWSLPFFPNRIPTSFLGRKLYDRTRSNYGFENEIFFDDLAERLKELQPVTPEKYPYVAQFDSKAYGQFAEFKTGLTSPSSNYVATCWRINEGPRYGERFHPTDSIDSQVKAIVDSFNEFTFGVHIRGTDAEIAKKHSNVDAFRNRIDAIISDHAEARFFLATDEPAIKEDLIQRYGDRILFFEQAGYSRSSSENIRNALIDLLCLSRTREVLGSYFSTFSNMAAQWHGIAETTIFKNKDQKEKATVK